MTTAPIATKSVATAPEIITVLGPPGGTHRQLAERLLRHADPRLGRIISDGGPADRPTAVIAVLSAFDEPTAEDIAVICSASNGIGTALVLLDGQHPALPERLDRVRYRLQTAGCSGISVQGIPTTDQDLGDQVAAALATGRGRARYQPPPPPAAIVTVPPQALGQQQRAERLGRQRHLRDAVAHCQHTLAGLSPKLRRLGSEHTPHAALEAQVTHLIEEHCVDPLHTLWARIARDVGEPAPQWDYHLPPPPRAGQQLERLLMTLLAGGAVAGMLRGTWSAFTAGHTVAAWIISVLCGIGFGVVLYFLRTAHARRVAHQQWLSGITADLHSYCREEISQLVTAVDDGGAKPQPTWRSQLLGTAPLAGASKA